MARISIPIEVIAVDDQDLASTLSNNKPGWHATSHRVSWNIQEGWFIIWDAMIWNVFDFFFLWEKNFIFQAKFISLWLFIQHLFP